MPELFAGLEGIDRVLMSIAFVFIAAAISRWQHSDLEKDLAIAAVRSFIQLIAIGYVLGARLRDGRAALYDCDSTGHDHNRRPHQRGARQENAKRCHGRFPGHRHRLGA